MASVSYNRGDFVVFNYGGTRWRGIFLYFYGRLPVLYILDVCVKRKWIDYKEYWDKRGWSWRGDDSRRVMGTERCVVKVLPQHRLVPYKFKGALGSVRDYLR